MLTYLHRHASVLFVAILLVSLWFGLNPKGYTFRNQADWTRQPEGLTFVKNGVAFLGPLPSEEFVSDSGDVSFIVELGLVPAETPPDGFSVLFQLTNENPTTQFVLGQWRHEFILMTGADFSFEKRLPRIILDLKTADKSVHRLTMAIDSDGTALYHNGRLVRFHPELKCRVFETRADLWCVLGNSIHGKHPWRGTLKWFAIYRGSIDAETVGKRDRIYRENGWSLPPADDCRETVVAFSFSRDEASSIVDRSGSGFHLTVPQNRAYVKPAFFEDSIDNVRWERGGGMDLFLNIFGFVPVGFALALLIDRNGLGLGPGRWMFLILVGSALSLIIELLQAWIPTRSSSALDWGLNTSGTVLAGGLYINCLRILRKSSASNLKENGVSDV